MGKIFTSFSRRDVTRHINFSREEADFFTHIGEGSISKGVRKAAVVSQLVAMLDGRDFDRATQVLIRMVEELNSPDWDDDLDFFDIHKDFKQIKKD